MFSSHFATYTLGAAYDEMFGAGGVARSHYELLSDRLQQLGSRTCTSGRRPRTSPS